MWEWLPPVKSDLLVFECNKPYLYPYLFLKPQMAGFFGDVWDGIKSVGETVWSFVWDNKYLIAPAVATGVAFATSEEVRENPGYALGPLGMYYLGYALTKWKSNPQGAVDQGLTELGEDYSEFEKYPAYEVPGMEVEAWPEYAPAPMAYEVPEDIEKLGTTVQKSSVLKDLLTMGTQIAAPYIANLIQGEAQKTGTTSQQTIQQGQAYTTRYATEFAAMGMTPEQALASIMYATGGAAPNPDTTPQEYLKISPMVPVEAKTFLQKYELYIAGGVGLLLVMKMMKKEKE